MSKEKNKNTFRIGALLLVACLISSVMLSGTFAKYTNEYAGQDTALVARWSFTSASITGGTAGAPIDLPIWDHNYATNIYQHNGSDYLIAPGIQGEFTVDFTYDADVDAYLTFDFTKSGNAASAVPIQYSIDGFDNIYYDLDDLEDAIVANEPNISPTATPGQYIITDTSDGVPVVINKTVSWRWPYEDDILDDTLHNTVANAQKRTLAGFAGTGAAIAATTPPSVKWTDADDTAIGNASEALGGLNRSSYVLKLVVKAVQREPGAANFTMASITGTPQIGQTLSAGALGGTTDGVTYQWQVSNAAGNNYTAIAGAISSTYVVDDDDVDAGQYIRVVATGDEIDSFGTVTSAPVGPIQ